MSLRKVLSGFLYVHRLDKQKARGMLNMFNGMLVHRFWPGCGLWALKPEHPRLCRLPVTKAGNMVRWL